MPIVHHFRRRKEDEELRLQQGYQWAAKTLFRDGSVVKRDTVIQQQCTVVRRKIPDMQNCVYCVDSDGVSRSKIAR